MKLSLRGEYALRALIVLGLNYDKPVVPIQMISLQQNIPKRFLEQILNDLKVGSSRVDLQACKLEYSIVSPK